MDQLERTDRFGAQRRLQIVDELLADGRRTLAE
jgi:hypothetical protein